MAQETNTYTETWNAFVRLLVDDKKNNVIEEIYHRHIETVLPILNWLPYNICHRPTLQIGNRNAIQPDIVIQQSNNKPLFVIEVKRPQHTQTKNEVEQLRSYMRFLGLKVGIYIGEHLEVFYDIANNTQSLTSILKAPLEKDNEMGALFVEYFSRNNFNKERIEEFCKQRIAQIERQKKLDEIKNEILSNPQSVICECLKEHISHSYGELLEDEINKMLSTLSFTASFNASQVSCVSQPKRVTKRAKTNTVKASTPSSTNGIECFCTRNCDAKGIFNPENNHLTVLIGSTINKGCSPKADANIQKRHKEYITQYAKETNGIIEVIKEKEFESPSGASTVCCGYSSNGWIDWHDKNGVQIKKYKKDKTTKIKHIYEHWR